MALDDKPLYIALEANVPVRGAEDVVPLIRKVDASYFSETVYNVMQKLIDGEGDSLNDPYNNLEKQVANTVQSWFNEMESSPDDYKVSVLAFDKENTEISLDLQKTLGTYESIIKYKEETETDPDTGEISTEKYKLVELFARRSVKSGIESLL